MVALRCKEIICELKALAEILSEDDAEALSSDPKAQHEALESVDSLRKLVRRLGDRSF